MPAVGGKRRTGRNCASCDDIHQPVRNHNDFAWGRPGELPLNFVGGKSECLRLSPVEAAARGDRIAKLAIDLNGQRDLIIDQ